jgi:hypothetical protein
VIFTRCAGLDVHQKTAMACRVTPDPLGQQADGILEVWEFGTSPRDLIALSGWLVEAGISHVAMESTGEYGKPVYNLLEGTCTVFLVNVAHVKHMPGQKTDRADARWLANMACCRRALFPPRSNGICGTSRAIARSWCRSGVGRSTGCKVSWSAPTSRWRRWRRILWGCRAGPSWPR